MTKHADPLAEFIANGDDWCQITRQKGEITTLNELSKAYTFHMRKVHLKNNEKITDNHYAIIKAGYEKVIVNICKTCNKKSTKDNCGLHYDRSPANTAKKVCCMDMKIIKKEHDNYVGY